MPSNSAEAPIDLTLDSDSDGESGGVGDNLAAANIHGNRLQSFQQAGTRRNAPGQIPLFPRSAPHPPHPPHSAPPTHAFWDAYPRWVPQPPPSSAIRPYSDPASAAAPTPEIRSTSDKPIAAPPAAPPANMWGIPSPPTTAPPIPPMLPLVSEHAYVAVHTPQTQSGRLDEFETTQAEKRRKTSVQKTKFYGVQVGHVAGVYTNYKEALNQVTGCKGGKLKGFDTRGQAQAFVDGRPNALESVPVAASTVPARQPPPMLPLLPMDTWSWQRNNEMPGASNDIRRVKEFSQSLQDLKSARAPNPISDRGTGTAQSFSVAGSQSIAVRDPNVTMVDQQSNSDQTPSTQETHFQSTMMASTIDDRLDALVEDDTYIELLQQAPAFDKIALSLEQRPRSKRIMGNMRSLVIPTKPNRISDERSPSQDTTGTDSVFSGSDRPTSGSDTQVNTPASNLPTAHRVVATVEDSASSNQRIGPFSDAETHLLIFLKEVKKFNWREITIKFQQHYSRTYGTIQTHYSQKVNRRDRSKDPPTLMLPAMYASEATINWNEVHPNASRLSTRAPKQKRERNTSLEEPRHRARSAVVGAHQDSGAESTGHRTRPQRAVPVKNYTWPNWRTSAIVDSSGGDDAEMGFADERQAPSKTPEADVAVPKRTIRVDNEPLQVDFDRDDALSALAVQQHLPGQEQQPYLSSSELSALQNVPLDFEWDQSISRDWQGARVHVDFSSAELQVVESTTARLYPPRRQLRSQNLQKRLQRLLNGVSEPQLLKLAATLKTKLPARDRRSIEAFLLDAQGGKIRSDAPRIKRLAAPRPDKSYSSEMKASASSVIRRRELGLQSNRGWKTTSLPVSYQLKNKLQDSLGPACSYTGASHDVHALAWSVDGQCFAAGAICVDDPDSMQYNRPNNLLYGDVFHNTIHELGKHCVARPKTESGPNSTHAMYASQDPKLFKTVTSVAFSPNGRYMYSGGWDQNVWVWDTRSDGSQPSDVVSLHHKAKIDMMAVNSSGILATGTRRSSGNSVKVLKLHEDDLTQAPVTSNFSSEQAEARPDDIILPTALQFSPRWENLLAVGFGADASERRGDTCLWDINTNQRLDIWGGRKRVFDLSFHSRNRWIAVASAPDTSNNRGIRSTVRVYDELRRGMGKFSCLKELECPALDINDISWCPGNDFVIAAGCTSGRAYVWDIRNPDQFLCELAHGSSLMPLDDFRSREETDSGIGLLSWGHNDTRLYSGSSDGVVKVWNTTRSEEDVFVKDLVTLDSGIISGAFSPDLSRLLLGEVNGSVNVLEVGRDDCSLKDASKMDYIPYKDADPEFDIQLSGGSAAATTGVGAARELIETGRMMTRPMGGLPVKQAVQGPLYDGPYDFSVDAPFLREQALELQLQFSETTEPPCSVCLGSDVKITSEELGDSSRSQDRIPDELRSQWTAGNKDIKIPTTKVPCALCGRAARPSDRTDPTNGAPLPPMCERCSFACIRCGHDANVSIDVTLYTCSACELTWDIGALGYEVVQNSMLEDSKKRERVKMLNDGVPKPDRFKQDVHLTKLDDDDELMEVDQDAAFGDEMNALTDYYFSLDIDRPESAF